MPVAVRTALTLAAGIAALSVAACGSGGQGTPAQDHTTPASQGTPTQGTPTQATPSHAAAPASQDSTSPAAQPSTPAAQFKVPGQLTAAAVTSFQLTQGQPSWAAGEQREVAGSSWTFGPSGSFSWTTTDTADMAQALLPVTGSYTASADGIAFHGTHTVTSSVGSRTVVVDGSVQQGSSGYQVAMRMTSSSGMGAAVDGQQLAQANSAANQSVITARAS